MTLAASASPATRTTLGIVAFHRPDALARLLAQCADGDLDVVVVNVGADPQVADVAAHAGCPVRVVVTDNRGYGAAVNLLATAARGDVVVFTNDDVELEARTVGVLADVVRAGDAAAALPRVVGGDGSDEGTVLALPTPGRLFAEWAVLPDRPVRRLAGWLPVEKWRRPEVRETVDAGTAVTVAVRTEVLRAEPFPEDYFLYWEEIEWFWRLRDAGHRVVLVPEVTVVHDGGREDVRPEKAKLLARNAVRCVRRTQGRASAALAYLVVLCWQLRLVAVDGARWLARPGSDRRARVRARLAGFGAAGASWREIW